jgi:pyridoxine/pyridoxamine 5'-phosphate oxidase
MKCGVLMGNLFVERRPEEGDYAIRRPGADRISGHESTQAEAIERAREIDPNAAVLVERVRYTDRGHPDKWRRP